jgi:hypothetical protein
MIVAGRGGIQFCCVAEDATSFITATQSRWA